MFYQTILHEIRMLSNVLSYNIKQHKDDMQCLMMNIPWYNILLNVLSDNIL